MKSSFDHVVVDVEIQRCVEDTPGGWEATDKLGVAVACVWEYHSRRMRVYGPKDVQALQERLERADQISGFNIWRFDFPVIYGCPKSEWRADSGYGSIFEKLLPKTNDALRRIWLSLGLNPDTFSPSTHGGWGLDAVAKGTLRAGKIGYGGDAPKWYQAGEIQKVANYCADDVALERDLTDFIDHYGYVLNGTTGRLLQITTEAGR